MPFGFVTKRQLDAHREELAKQMRAMEVEWSEWFDKFRRLYARLSKRVSDAEEVDKKADEEALPGKPAITRDWVKQHSRRGF